MANVLNVNTYQINSQDPIPLPQVTKIGFPVASSLLRAANDPTGNPGILLSTGIRCYGQIQLVPTGTIYLVQETEATLVTLANT